MSVPQVIFEGSLAEKLRFWASNLHFWRKSRRKALFLTFNASFLKEVSQKSFVFELQSFIFEGSLAVKALFLIFNASFLKEVSQKSFVFELQSVNFEGSLAEKLCFWPSTLHFWRKSRRKASFLSFKASILKEVSQNCFVFDLQRFIFEGSLAQKLRFGAWKLQFWRKSRRKALFLTFNASFLKEVSQKSFVFELQSVNFEGSLAELLRFWSSKIYFWRKSRTKASFWSLKAAILKEVSQKCLVFDLQSFNFEGSLAEMLGFWSSKLRFWRKSRRKENPRLAWAPKQLVDNQITWIPNRLTNKSLASQIRWQPNHLSLNSFEPDINWLSNRWSSTHPVPIGSLW